MSAERVDTFENGLRAALLAVEEDPSTPAGDVIRDLLVRLQRERVAAIFGAGPREMFG